MKPQDGIRQGPMAINASILRQSIENNSKAVQTMFRQFIPADEEVLFTEYLGVQGLWWVGRHSFGCLTNRRICSLMVGPWGEVIYQDALLEDHNSGIVYQPGLLGLYVLCGFYIATVGLFTFGLGLLLLPYVIQYYYRMNKCGLLWKVKEGVAVYLFTNRNKLGRANNLFRLASAQHDKRLAELARLRGTLH